MMYAQGDEFIKDFVMRTKSNLFFLEKSQYEVTQLINSMIGFLIIPEQKQYNHIVDGMIDDVLFQKISNCIDKNTYSTAVNLQQICRHLRNAVAHSNISFQAEKPNISSQPLIIHSAKFVDENKRTNEYIEITLTIELLKEFLIAFSEAVSNLP